MARPHMVVYREIKERIKTKNGSARVDELKKVLDELPGYKTGPYAEIRKWVLEQIEKTKTISKVEHKDWIGVRKEGEAQVALVGQPNTGKSSLAHALTGIQIKIADYAFTTLKPIPAVMKHKGIEIQLVDIPGLVEGAREDKGGGRRLLGILREMNGLLYVHDATKPVSGLRGIVNEVEKAGIKKPSVILCNKMDLAGQKELESVRREFPNMEIIPVSMKTGLNVEIVRETIWKMSGLIRVFTKGGDSMALKKGSTVEDFASKIHKDLVRDFRFAKIWGTSVKFPGQQVGLEHTLEDDDTVELHTLR